MKQVTYLLLSTLLLISCGKKEKEISKSSDKQEIIDALNIGDSQRAEASLSKVN